MARLSEQHVLIVSTKVDAATDAVIRALDKRGATWTRLNTEDLPFDATLTAVFAPSSEVLSLSYRAGGMVPAPLQDVTSIWYRRVRAPERPATMLPGVYDFCLREARAAVLGAVLAVSTGRVMSPPANVWAAEHKTLQLATAQAAGLIVPETVITNDPDEVRQAFRRFNGRMIVKPVRSGFVDYGEEQHAVYTTQVLEEHLSEVESARWSPTIYQPLIAKRCDVRVTAVGGDLFVAEIDSQTDPAAVVDWRRTVNPALPHRRAELPFAVSDGVRRLLATLGLRFGAIDFIRTPDDEYVFLEVNPNGQWLWLDDMLDLGISDAVAAWLLGEAS